MEGWVDLGAGGIVNLAQVMWIGSEPLTGSPGNIRFYFPDGTYTQAVIGPSAVDALDGIRRVVDTVDPTTYS